MRSTGSLMLIYWCKRIHMCVLSVTAPAGAETKGSKMKASFGKVIYYFNGEKVTIPLYYHKTDGGAEYLTDTFISQGGHKEGCFKPDTKLNIRIDGGELEVMAGFIGYDEDLTRVTEGLEKYGALVEKDICDQDTGWYYQFGHALELVRNLLHKRNLI